MMRPHNRGFWNFEISYNFITYSQIPNEYNHEEG